MAWYEWLLMVAAYAIAGGFVVVIGLAVWDWIKGGE